jgi:hypothetical protein
MKPIIVEPGSELGEFSIEDLSEAFNFLRDEYLSAVDYLESLGIPVQVDNGEDGVETRPLVKMIEVALNKHGEKDDE